MKEYFYAALCTKIYIPCFMFSACFIGIGNQNDSILMQDRAQEQQISPWRIFGIYRKAR